MALYRYVKKTGRKQPRTTHSQFNSRLISGLLVVVGIFFLANAAYPIITYQLLVSPRFANSFVSPSTEAAIAQSFGTAQDKSSGVAQVRSSGTNNDAPALGIEIELLDLTKANNWFPESSSVFEKEEQSQTSYFLSIPKLGIESALVVQGVDLKKSLVQYPGTPSPGKFGNTIIFGHSILPQFFNPKNYLAIFSTLPTLKQKDEVIINYNEVTYKYIVEQMIEVTPEDISILAQRYDDSYLTLITCVPPGTYLKRLIIRARLIKI